MINTSEPRVVVPSGQLAGKTATGSEAVQSVFRELLTETASKKDRVRQIFEVRRSMLALWLIEWQLHTPQEKIAQAKSVEGIRELVDLYRLALPGDIQSLYNLFRNSKKAT